MNLQAADGPSEPPRLVKTWGQTLWRSAVDAVDAA